MRKAAFIWTIMFLAGCEFFIAPDDTLNPQTGEVTEIRFPNLILNGPNPIIFIAGQAEYVEQGATATLGSEDISDQIEISGAVDSEVPGLYEILYSISVINELGNPSTVTNVRNVAVLFEDVSDIDLSGAYSSTGDFFGPETMEQQMTVSKISDGHFTATDIMGYPNSDQPGTIFYLGQGMGKLARVSADQSIFGLTIQGDVAVVPGSELIIDISLPEVMFGFQAPWKIE